LGFEEDQWYRKGLFLTLKDLDTSQEGLSQDEAKKRLIEHGPNRLAEVKKKSLIIKFLEQFKGILIIILILAAIASAFIGLNSDEGSLLIKLSDTIVILVVITINAIVGFFQEFRAEKAMDALKQMANPRARVQRDGKEEEIPAEELVPGDVIIVDEGVKVPADAYLMDANNLRVDESALTGESVSVSKDVVAYIEELPLSKQKNMLFSTTIVTGGNGKAVVVRTGMKTEIGKIATLVQSSETEMTPLQKRLDKLGKQIALYAGIVCFIVLVINIISHWETITETSTIHRFLLTSISLAVAVIPEGLPVIVIVTLAIGIQEMAKKNAIIRNIPSVETLGGTTVICTDKTGTLTRNEMTAREMYFDDKFISVTGEGYDTTGKFLMDGKSLDPKKCKTLETILRTVVLCNNSVMGESENKCHGDVSKPIGDSTENAMLVLGMKGGVDLDTRKRYERIKEFTFDSALKRMSVVHRIDDEFFLFVKGAPSVITGRCNKISKDGKIIPFGGKDKKKMIRMNNKLAGEAMRVLAVAYKKIDVSKAPSPYQFIHFHDRDEMEKDLVFLGLVGMIDPPRKATKEAVRLCKRAGVRVVMITGDQKPTAVTIGKELGIITKSNQVLTGPELEKMSQKELEKRVEGIRVFAMAVPAHKLSVISALKKKGHVVAMTGDGVNDAPALTKADIGISMGITGTDVAKEASDMILTDDNFGTIERAIEGGRRIYNNIRRFIRYQFSTSVGAILVILVATIFSKDLPLLPAQILWINIIMDGPPALALAMEPVKGNVMERPPIDPKKGIISKKMLASVFLLGIFMCIGTLYIFFGSQAAAGYSVAKAQTMAFTIFVLFQLFNVFNCRSDEESIFKKGFFSNKYIIWAVSFSLILQICVVYVPFLQDLFHTVPLNGFDWLAIIIMSSLILAVDEIYVKAIGNRL
jgi:Ca2+-transporting ATPase